MNGVNFRAACDHVCIITKFERVLFSNEIWAFVFLTMDENENDQTISWKANKSMPLLITVLEM